MRHEQLSTIIGGYFLPYLCHRSWTILCRHQGGLQPRCSLCHAVGDSMGSLGQLRPASLLPTAISSAPALHRALTAIDLGSYLRQSHWGGYVQGPCGLAAYLDWLV
ncbi:hypothetical protein D3C75_1140270 [compost metagenome]